MSSYKSNYQNEEEEQPLLVESKDSEISDISEKRSDKRSDDRSRKGDESVQKDYFGEANFFSRIFYIWGFKMIQQNSKEPLTTEKIANLHGEHTCEKFMEKTYNAYNVLGYRYSKSLALIKTIIRANIFAFSMVFLFGILSTAINVAVFFIFRKLIQVFIAKNEELTAYIAYSLGFLSLKFIGIFFNKQLIEWQIYTALESEVELICMVFDKILKISPSSPGYKAENGEIVNFVSVDSNKFFEFFKDCQQIILIPIMLIVYSFLLFKFLGWTFIFGLLIFIINIAVVIYIQTLHQKYQSLRQSKIDARLNVTSQTLYNLKVLKLYAWDDIFLTRIKDAKDVELDALKYIFILSAISRVINWMAPMIAFGLTLYGYHRFNKQYFIEDIFMSLGIFWQMGEPFRQLSLICKGFVDISVSFGRLEKFLNQEEINKGNVILDDENSIKNGYSIEIENGNFSWGTLKTQGDNTQEKSENNSSDLKEGNKSGNSANLIEENSNEKSNKANENTVLELKENDSNLDAKLLINLHDINLKVKQGEFICILGEVGSGKSSLLNAILNNMRPISKNGKESKVIVNGKIAYVSQNPWIMNKTIRENITFYKNFDEEEYNKIIRLSELQEDLKVLEQGDMTEIGDKGVNLSGGQKARVSIARALYLDCDIYLLDDPLSSLDAHIGKKIFENCICGLLKNKTRILITHADQYASSADRIIFMNKGKIQWIGTPQELHNQNFYKMHLKKQSSELIFEKNKNTNDSQGNFDKSAGNNTPKLKKLLREEDRKVGSLKSYAYLLFGKYIGIGRFVATLLLSTGMEGFQLGCELMIMKLCDQKDKNFIDWKYLNLYMIFFAIASVFAVALIGLAYYFSIEASRNLHTKIITSIVDAPINLYHDTVPKGRLMNRLARDMDLTDNSVPVNFTNALITGFKLVGTIVICLIFSPYSLILIPFIAITSYFVMSYYLNCSREIFRIEGMTLSPILNLTYEALFGADSIRAYRREEKYVQANKRLNDDFTKVEIYNNGTTLWFYIILDFLSFIYITVVVILSAIMHKKFSPAVMGLLLTYCILLEDVLLMYLQFRVLFEGKEISLERCDALISIAPEKKYSILSRENALRNWPTEGKISFENYSVRYRPDSEEVLHHININIKGGEKIGIAGKSGSGKSTISLCLFRILEATEGTIFIDDVDISQIDLKKLRESISIIPQDPTIMEGTLRFNIDPLNKYSDDEIIEAITKVGLTHLLDKEKNFGLEMNISADGMNISVGEKQLICIVRALLKKSKIIIMDEATAHIDVNTEKIIQESLKDILPESTFLTMAHRIKTILNYDRVLVLDKGNVAEFDTPQNLLKDKNSKFYQLYHNQK